MGTPAESIHHGSRDVLEQRRQYPREHSIRYLESHLESHLAAPRRRRIERPMAVEMGEGPVNEFDVDSVRIHHPISGLEGFSQRSARDFQACRHHRGGARMYRRGTAPGKKPRVALDIGDEAEHVRRRERNVSGTRDSGHPSIRASHRARRACRPASSPSALPAPVPCMPRVGKSRRRGEGTWETAAAIRREGGFPQCTLARVAQRDCLPLLRA